MYIICTQEGPLNNEPTVRASHFVDPGDPEKEAAQKQCLLSLKVKRGQELMQLFEHLDIGIGHRGALD